MTRTGSFEGVAADSITLDVGEANLAAGRLDPLNVEPGPHTLTIWGQSVLDGDDFIPTVSYVGLFSSGNGSAETTGSRSALPTARSTVTPARSPDGRWRARHFHEHLHRHRATRRRWISDFLRGQDLLDGTFDFGPGGPSGGLNFPALDANSNGVLDAGDDAARITEATAYEPGIAPRVGISTAIDLDVAYGLSLTWTETNSMTVVGVTGLTSDDFVDPGAAAVA